MPSPVDQLLEKVTEIEQLLKASDAQNLERICAAALKIVYYAPTGNISKVASTVATSARLWIENPSKATLYERPLQTAVKNLRRALTEASSTD
ncbi:MAG TPA: hypothetical protein VM183_04250 [Burkholderiales bacterium]|nr:hypothetical protein [Burkholderiales bacterium]